jgi:nicotinate-nucleotide adenylyltransferase
MTRRVGILGGTFDPIHVGHRDLGRAAEVELGLTQLLLVPAHIPPHRAQPIASPYHRFAMVALTVNGRIGWQASDFELRSGAPSYTSQTLQYFHAHGFGAVELFFVIGADAFLDIATWKDYPAILDAAHFAVVSRPGFSVADLPGRLPDLAPRMTRPVPHLHAGKPMVFLIDAPTSDVSATAIRARCASGKSIAGLVEPSVSHHIEQHQLYRSVEPRITSENAGGGSTVSRLHGHS